MFSISIMQIQSKYTEQTAAQVEPQWMATLKRQVQSLRFGTVQLVVHESQVVQIETTEKVRFEPSARSSNNSPQKTLTPSSNLI